jgi:hypothetical protein
MTLWQNTTWTLVITFCSTAPDSWQRNQVLISEGMALKFHSNSMNKDNGFYLSRMWRFLLTPWRKGGRRFCTPETVFFNPVPGMGHFSLPIYKDPENDHPFPILVLHISSYGKSLGTLEEDRGGILCKRRVMFWKGLNVLTITYLPCEEGQYGIDEGNFSTFHSHYPESGSSSLPSSTGLTPFMQPP